MNIGLQIRRARVHRGLTQYDVADLIHGFQPDISDWELNKRLPDTLSLIRLAEALNVPVGYIYTDEEQPSP